MSDVFKELLFRLRAGPRRTWTWLGDRLTDRTQDRSFGIETTGTQTARANERDFVGYQPVSYRDLREAMALVEVKTSDYFLDVGSGMGRAVCFAATQPFRKITGVEISEELCAAARRNLTRVEKRARCRDVEIVAANVLRCGIPQDVSLIFLFHPLEGEALGELLARIEQSWIMHPRLLRVLFTGTLSSRYFVEQAARHRLFHLVEEKTLDTGARALLYNVQHRG